MLQEMPVMSSGGGGVDISDIINQQYNILVQSNQGNAIYTVGMKKILFDVTDGMGRTIVIYSDSSATQAISSTISSTETVDVSNYNVVFAKGSAATVLTHITVKE